LRDTASRSLTVCPFLRNEPTLRFWGDHPSVGVRAGAASVVWRPLADLENANRYPTRNRAENWLLGLGTKQVHTRWRQDKRGASFPALIPLGCARDHGRAARLLAVDGSGVAANDRRSRRPKSKDSQEADNRAPRSPVSE